MADQQALEMIARIRDEATPILKNLQREMDRLGKGSAIRDTNSRFTELSGTMSKLGGEMKNVLAPALGAIGLSSLTAGAAVGIMISKLQSMGEGAVKFQYLEKVTGTSAANITKIAHASERLGVDSDAAIASFENFARIQKEMVGGRNGLMTGQAKALHDQSRAGGVFFRELVDGMRQSALAGRSAWDTFISVQEKIGKLSPAEQAMFNERLGFQKQWIDFAKVLAAEKSSGITSLDIEMMKQYHDAMLNLDHAASKLWKTLALKVEPFFELQLKGATAFLETLNFIENKLGKIWDWKRLLTGGIDIFGTGGWVKNQLFPGQHMPNPEDIKPGESTGGWPVAVPLKPEEKKPPPAPVQPVPVTPVPAPSGLSPRNTFNRFNYGGPDVFSSGQTPTRNEAIAAELLARGRKRFQDMQGAEQKRIDEVIKNLAPAEDSRLRDIPAPRAPAAAPAREEKGFADRWKDTEPPPAPKPDKGENERRQRDMQLILDGVTKRQQIEAPSIQPMQPQPDKRGEIFERPTRQPSGNERSRLDLGGPEGWASTMERMRAQQQQQQLERLPLTEWRRLDRSLAAQTGAVRLEGAADISVSVTAPRGTNVDASSRGMFNPPSISRSQQMGFANPNGEQPFTGGSGAW